MLCKTLWVCAEVMKNLGLSQEVGINGDGKSRGLSANPGSHGKMAIKTVYVSTCVCVCGCV